VSASTLVVPIARFGTLGVPTQWGLPAEVRIMASIMLGIEQARRNEGTLLGDTDLATGDDD